MKECYECETTEDLQEHHVVPRSRGGTKTVTLCYQCHMKAHGRSGKGLNHGKLTKEALAVVKSRGVKLGTHRAGNLEAVKEAHRKKGRVTAKKYRPTLIKALWKAVSAHPRNKPTLRGITDILTMSNVKTPRGNHHWSHGSLATLLKRCDIDLKDQATWR